MGEPRSRHGRWRQPHNWRRVEAKTVGQSITAFVREASIEKPEVQRLKKEGIEVTSIDLEASHDELVQKLKSQDIVISCIIPVETKPQIALADACKAANVKRFVPSAFGPATPPEGVLILKDIVAPPSVFSCLPETGLWVTTC